MKNLKRYGIPKEMVVLGKRFKITIVKELTGKDSEDAAVTLFNPNEMYIVASNRDDMWDSYYHEMFHVVCRVVKTDQAALSSDLEDILAANMAEAIMDNKKKNRKKL